MWESTYVKTGRQEVRRGPLKDLSPRAQLAHSVKPVPGPSDNAPLTSL